MKSAGIKVFMGDFESCFIRTKDGEDVTFGWLDKLKWAIRSLLLWNFVPRLKEQLEKLIYMYVCIFEFFLSTFLYQFVKLKNKENIKYL